MASTDAGLSNLSLATYSNSTYYSTFFNGSTDYLTIASNAAFAFGTGDFTVEAWICYTGTLSATLVPITQSDAVGASTNDKWFFAFNNSTLYFNTHSSGGFNATTPFSLTTNTWYHVAVVRQSGTMKMYINGVSGTVSVTGTPSGYTLGQNGLTIGAMSTPYYLTGYISNLRLLKGTALYTASFNVPNVQLTAITNTSLLTCNTNSFTDSSVNNFTITRVGNTGFKQFTPTLQVTTSATLTPTFSTGTLTYTISVPSNITAISVTPTAVDPALASIKYNGNVTLTSGQSNIASAGPAYTIGYSTNFVSGLLQYANATQLNTNGYSWTVEFWINPVGTYTAYNTMFTKRVSALTTTAYQGYLAPTTGYIGFYNGTLYTSTYTLPANTWSHVAYTYDGSQVSIYVNGNKVYGVVVTITDNTEPLTIGGARGYTEWMIGNISNFRMVKGYVIYTQNFTPSTTPLGLTQSSGTGIRAISGAPTNGNSAYFSGASHYLVVTDNTAINFDTGLYTIECWVYTLVSGSQYILSKGLGGASATGWILRIGNSNTIDFLTDTGAGLSLSSTTTITTFKWTHIAITRNASNLVTLYKDGIAEASGTSTYNMTRAYDLRIGEARQSTATNILNGYISNLRLVKGFAIYTANFTPSTIPLTIALGTGLLALQNNLLTDASTNNLTITNNTNVKLSTAMSPFNSAVSTIQPNGSSVYFNGSTNLTGSADFTATGNFTIECWIYPTVSTECDILTIGSEATGRILFGTGLPSAGNLFYNIYGSSSVALSSNISINRWQHVAIVRIGTTITGYVNGVAGTPVTGVTGTLGNTSGFSIMNNGTGYITNLRYVNGTALYISNFTVYNSPLVAVTNTKLLALQSGVTTDASTNNYTLTATSPAPTLSTTISPFITVGAASTQFLSTALAYQQVSNPYVPALSLGQGHNNFTAEAWVYLTATPPVAPGWYIMQKGVNSTPGLEWSFSVTSTGLYFQTTSGIPTGTTTSTAFGANIIPGQWMHLALTKVGTSVNVWFNGFYTGTVNGVNNLFYSTSVASYITIANTQTGATTAFAGFISNARVVYGKALYTVNYDTQFTPSTGPLSLTQSATATVASIDNASSYTVVNGSSVLFNNTNDFLTFPEPASYFYSALFNGSTQSLSIPSNAAFTFGTGDFTIEFWFYGASQLNSFFYDNRNATSATYPHITTGASVAALRWGPTNITGSIIIANNNWHHCAVTRQSGTVKLWVDGVLDASGSDTTDYNTNYAALIGNNSFGSNYVTGNISNFRVIKGTALYTSAFTPSTIPLTRTSQGATSSQVSLLTLQNSTIIDNSTNAFTITNNGTTTTSQNHPFQLYGDGTDVTVEAWVLLGANPTTRGWIINNSATTTGYFGVAIDAARTVSVWSDSNVTAVLTSATLIPLGTWTHIAVTYVNQLLVIYINGVRDTNTIGKSTVWQAATLGTVYIGRQASAAAQYFPGYITNLRMVYGLAVYTSKFTVPSSPLTAITNTVFLGLQSSATVDASTNNTTITRGSGATGLILSPLTSPFTTYLPSVTNGNSIAFGWQTAAGNADFLTLATGYVTSTQLPGDFTLESWLYLAVLPASWAGIIDTRTVSTDAGYYFGVASNGTCRFGSSNADVITSTTVLAINTWYHLAITRLNGVIRLWINGVQETTTVASTSDFGVRTQSNPNIGRFMNPFYFSGYLSNIRLIIGTAIYTGTFIPSITPYSLTSSASTNTLAVSGVTTYPAVDNPNGVNYSGSYYFGGGQTTTGIQIPVANIGKLELATYDFTIEAWFYCTLNSGTQTIMCAANTATSADFAWVLYITRATATTGTIVFQSYTGVPISTLFTGSTGSINFNSNQWYHIAAVRIGNTYNTYLNGVSVFTGTFSSGQYLGSVTTTTTTFSIGAQYSSSTYTNHFYGYISNVRVIRGYGVYTGTFAPPTGPLTNTQVSGTNIIALNNAIPSLGNSVYFNGTTDYMKVPSISSAMGTGDFTIETYYYPTSFAAITTILGQYTAATTGLGYWNIQITTAGIITVYYNGSTNFTASTAILVNEWVHIALVRISGTITLYVNGVSYGTVSFATQFGLTSVASPIHIGVTQAAATYAVGYMSNLRIVKGLGVYTGAFTVPSSPLSSTQSSGTNIAAITGTSTSLLLYQNSPFIDNSSYADIITPFGNPQYSPVFSPSFFAYPTPANSNSGYFNGTSSFLSLTQPSNAGTADFTIELWVYPTSLAAISYLLSTSTIVANCFHLWIATTGTVNLAIDSATASITSVTPSLAKINTWTHIAITRTTGVVYMYVNGFRQGTTPAKATQFGDTGVLNIGRYQPTPGQYFTGYITNVRFVYGTPAVYTGNPYTAPPYINPLTAVTNTTLLLLQTTVTKDNSVNNVTITNTSVVLSTYTNPYTMMKLPVILAGQNSRDVTSTTGFRDNSMYNATLTSSSLSFASYQNAVSPYGITPALLLGQSSMTRDNSINNYRMSIGSGTPSIMPYVTPFNGDAIAFNGTTQYITGSSLFNGLGGDFTIEFFMMAGPQTATVGGLILGKNDVYTTSFNNYYIMCSRASVPGNTIRIYNNAINTTGPVYAGTIPVCDSKWHHVAIVRISNIVTIYIDGVADTGTLGTINRFTSTTTWDYSNYTIGSAPTTSGYTVANLAYNGMLSNLRIINGVGIYTGVFTPPTNNLTKSQTSGTNIVAYTPSVPPSSTSYSLQFKSQVSAYPYIGPALVGTNLFNNDYTVEFWHYLSGRVTGATVPCFFSNGNIGVAGNLNMYAGHTSSNIAKYQISFNTNSFPSRALVSSSDIVYGKWTHIAVVRRSGIVYLYINGVLDSSSTFGNYNVYGIYWYLGTAGEGDSQYLNGFISNFRVVNGVSVYTGNFTVPTSALTATQSSGTNIAEISNSLVANGGATNYYGTYQTVSAYYGAPLHFNTGKSDWTFETWVFLNTLPTVDTWAAGCMVLFGSDSAVTTDGIHCVIGTTQLFIAAANVKYGTALHGMSLYTWYHVAYVRYNNIVYFYVNGALVGTVTDVPVPGTQSTTYIAGAANTGTYSLNGYMSNLRFVRGMAVYTNAFTPSIIIPASQNSSTNVNAITGTSTSVLALQNSTTTDSSTNNFTLTVNGTPTPAVDTTIVPPFYYANGYSAYFNGGSSNDKLTLASSSAFDLSSGTYTIECWFYALTQPSAGNNTRLFMFGTNDVNPAQAFGFGPNNTIQMGGAFAGFTSLSSSTNAYSLNTWNHLAFVTYLGKATIYLNGAVVAGPLAMTQIIAGATTLNIGYDTVASVNFQYNGYLSNVRIVKGVAVYTGPFTPPTSPLTITQGSGTNISAITGVTPSDGYSLAFVNGSSQQLTLPSNAAFAMGTGSFTIECWFYTFSAGSAQAIYDTRSPTDTANIGYDLYLSATGPSIRFGTNATNYVIGTTTILSNKWYHVAVVRESTTVVKMYLNGVQEGTTGTVSATQNFTNNTPKIGGGAGGFFNGYISNLRVVKGQALYTTTFTPSANPLTTTSQGISTGTVSLLTAQNATIIDNSTNAFTITNSSSAVIPNSAITPFLGETELLMLQNTLINDSSINLFTATKTGSPVLNLTNTTYMPFTYANGKSVFFNGPSNYITIPSNAAFTFGTSDFTIEGWIYISVGTTGTLFDSRTDDSSVHPVLYVSSTIRYRVAGSDRIVGSTLTTSTWYHIAVSRNSGSTRLYVNGTQAGSTYTDSNDYIIGAPLVGAGYGYNAPLIGYISNLRVVKGTGVYPSKFNPITIPLTTTQTSTTNLQSISAKLPVNGNAAYASGGISVRGQFRYGNGFLFPGNFTIEAWINPYSLTTAYKAWFDSRASANDVTGICVGLTNTTGQWGAFSANNTNYVVSSVNLSLNTWQHVAVVRRGITMTLYLNGQNVGSATITNKFYTGNSYLGSQSDVNYGWIGYISNLRVVRDVAVYTGPFTPPTSPLGWYQPSGTNIVGSTKPVAPTNGSSVFFNGTTDYLVAPHIAAYQFTGNYSIECWFYTTTVDTSQMIMSKVSNKSTIDWYIKLNAYPGNGSTYATSSDPNSCQLEFYQGSPSVLLQSPIITYSSDTRSRMGGIYPNTWNHVAIVRSATTYYMIINGSYYNTSTMNMTVAGTPAYDITNNLNIGVNGVDYASNFFSGYITNVRLVNGTFAYSPSYYFSPSFMPLSTTQALNNFVASQTQNQTGVLSVTSAQTAFLGLQNTITGDNSTNNNTLTAYGTPSLSTAEHPFTLPLNGYSAYFNGQAYLQSASGPADFTTNTAWTMEAWFHWVAPAGADQVILDVYTALTTNEISIRTGSANTVRYQINSTTVITSATTVVSDAWNHVAVVKNGTTTTLYLNGVSQGTTTSVPTTGTRTLYIGSVSGSALFQGYISNVRIVKDVAVYTGNFTVPTSPLTTTQSSGTNISAITGSNTIALIIQKDMITDMSGSFTMQVGGGTAWPVIPSFPFSPFLTAANYVPSLLAFQTSYMNDTSPSKALFSLTGVQAGDATWMDYTYSPYGNITSLLTARTGKNVDNSVSSRFLSAAGYFTRVITPSGVQTPTAFLGAQTTTVLSDAGADDLATQGIMNLPANASTNSIFGPFNSDIPLLSFQDSIIIDNSNVRAQMTTVGAGVSPTDASPFTTPKSFTSLLIPYGYTDISISNTGSNYIANNANVAQTNFIYNPFTIPSTLVSVLGLQTSNILIDSSINNGVFTTANTTPTSNASSPFGTYYSNGILILNTSSTTGISGNTINYANLLVTAGDTVTTNAYSITVTSLANVGNIGNRQSFETGITTTQANANIALVDIGNSQMNEATILTFANTNITPSMSFVDYGISVAPSNITFIITDVANSNINESLNSIFVSNVSVITIPTDSGLRNVSPSNITFFISDVANSNISETIANVTISNVSTTRSIMDTGVQPPPSPVGGTVLFPTYAYTDGVVITAANVQSGGTSGTTASNQQIWYQT